MKKLIIACIVLSSISSCTFKEQQKDQKGSHLTWLDKFPVDSMIYRITEGNSDSEIYDITLLSGKKYIARTLPNTMSLHKLSHEIFMAKKTSDLKISPFLHFVSADERLLIMDFIEGEPFYAPKAKINLIMRV